METSENTHGSSGNDTERSFVAVAKQATGVMTSQFFGVILGIVSNVIFARLLGAELLGVYVLASTVLLIASLVATFGMAPTLVRYVPVRLSRGDRAGAAAIVAFALRIVVSLGAVLTVVLILARGPLAHGVFNEPRLAGVLPIAALGVVPASIALLMSGVLMALKENAKDAFCKEVVYKLAKLVIFLALFAAVGLKLKGLVIAFSAAYVISSAVMLLLVDRQIPEFVRGPRVPSVSTRELFGFGFTMFFVMFMNYAMSITDRTMLGILSTSENVGIYNIAFIISNVLAMVYMGFNVSFAPVISELYHSNRLKELSSLYASLTRTILIIVIPAFFWLVGFGDDLLRHFGREFVAGYAGLLILGMGALARCAVGSVGNLLMMSKHQRFNAANILISTAMNIGLNLYFIPRYGFVGAAIATAISIAVISVTGLVEVRVLLGLSPYRLSYLKIVTASAVTLPAMLLLRGRTAPMVHWQIGLVLIGTYAVFVGLIIALGAERDDVVLVEKLLARVGLAGRLPTRFLLRGR